jgi:hypothetical protein
MLAGWAATISDDFRPAEYINETTRAELDRLNISIPDIDEELIERYWRYLEGAHPWWTMST